MYLCSCYASVRPSVCVIRLCEMQMLLLSWTDLKENHDLSKGNITCNDPSVHMPCSQNQSVRCLHHYYSAHLAVGCQTKVVSFYRKCVKFCCKEKPTNLSTTMCRPTGTEYCLYWKYWKVHNLYLIGWLFILPVLCCYIVQPSACNTAISVDLDFMSFNCKKFFSIDCYAFIAQDACKAAGAFACWRPAASNDDDTNSLSWLCWLFTVWLCHTTGILACTAVSSFDANDASMFVPRFLDGTTLAQAIPPMATHLLVAWSVCLSVGHLRHWCATCTLLKPFDGFRCHLAGRLVGSNDTLC